MPAVGAFAVRTMEGSATRTAASDAPSGDAIVVLSEGRVLAPGRANISEWTDADRFFGGVELFKAHKAPWIVFTGGVTSGNANVKLEGQVLSEFAESVGVPVGHILTSLRVENTEQEARAVATLLRTQVADTSWLRREPRILLVTSAFHMARARRMFELAGLAVSPFPVDFKASERKRWSVVDFLPRGSALAQTELAMREMYGRIFYLNIR